MILFYSFFKNKNDIILEFKKKINYIPLSFDGINLLGQLLNQFNKKPQPKLDFRLVSYDPSHLSLITLVCN